MTDLKSPFFWFILAARTATGLAESPGENVHVVYLHAARTLAAGLPGDGR